VKHINTTYKNLTHQFTPVVHPIRQYMWKKIALLRSFVSRFCL